MGVPDGATMGHFYAEALSGLTAFIAIIPAWRAFQVIRAFIRG